MSRVKITPELRESLSQHEHIKQVYFAANGENSYNKYEFDGKEYIKLPSFEVYGTLKAADPSVVKPSALWYLIAGPLEIVATMTRDEILSTE